MQVIIVLLGVVAALAAMVWLLHRAIQGALRAPWQRTNHDTDVEIEAHRAPGHYLYTWNAQCGTCGWQGGDWVGAASSVSATRAVALKSHAAGDGRTIRMTRPCPVCDRPSRLGAVTCGDVACEAALAEVRRTAGA